MNKNYCLESGVKHRNVPTEVAHFWWLDFHGIFHIPSLKIWQAATSLAGGPRVSEATAKNIMSWTQGKARFLVTSKKESKSYGSNAMEFMYNLYLIYAFWIWKNTKFMFSILISVDGSEKKKKTEIYDQNGAPKFHWMASVHQLQVVWLTHQTSCAMCCPCYTWIHDFAGIPFRHLVTGKIYLGEIYITYGLYIKLVVNLHAKVLLFFFQQVGTHWSECQKPPHTSISHRFDKASGLWRATLQHDGPEKPRWKCNWGYAGEV